MQGSRFVFITAPAQETPDSLVESRAGVVLWVLVSPNNRPIGRATTTYESYGVCVAAVDRLRQDHSRVRTLTSAVEATGRWAWRVDLDGQPVAMSSRSYLRTRECQYNLDLFLEAVPSAVVVAGTREARGGRSAPRADPAVPRPAQRAAP